MYLSILPEDVDEEIGICRESWDNSIDVFIDGVDFIWDFAFLEKKRWLVFLGYEDNSLSGDDSDGGAGFVDGLDSVLDLLESAVGGKSCSFGVISARHFKKNLNYVYYLIKTKPTFYIFS